MCMIQFEDVSFQYPNGFAAIENVSFQIERGTNLAIIGQNGAGKTTTVKMMNGLLRPTAGQVYIDSMNTKDFTAAQMSKKVGYVFQNPDDQIFHNTIEEEIAFGPKVLGFDQKRTKEMIAFSVELVGMQDNLKQNPYDFPLSIRKFVTIASVIAMDTDILILDEPTAGQDLRGIKMLEHMLKILGEKGKTILTITHDMEFVANNFDKVFVMANKKLLREGSPREIFDDSQLLETAMLRRPFIRDICYALGWKTSLTSPEEMVQYLCAMGNH